MATNDTGELRKGAGTRESVCVSVISQESGAHKWSDERSAHEGQKSQELSDVRKYDIEKIVPADC